jgi:hypothetical protein
MTTITKITGTPILKRNGSIKGYRYDAHFDDGTIRIARASATRLYDFAFQYDKEVNGSGKTGLARSFCFGKKAPNLYGCTPIKVFTVVLGDDLAAWPLP